MQDTNTGKTGKIRGGSGLLLLALLGGAMALVCHQAFQAHYIMWANDTQFGPLTAASSKLPDSYSGAWVDFWWIGTDIPASSPTLATILATIISPATYLAVFTPLTMVLLGFSAWVLFRQLKFAPMVCVVAGLAAGLNMHCFSNACWGLGTWNVSIAMIFLALAALVTDSIRQNWAKAILAGLAVGMAVMEGFDSGAILSVYVGIFTAFFCWLTEATVSKRLIKVALVGTLVVVFAGLIAFNTLHTLVKTQISSGASAGQTAEDKKANWPFATQWSLPKLETLRVIIPGIFGYRMDEFSTPPDPFSASLGKIGGLPERFMQGLADKSSAYWGRVGEDLNITILPDLESSNPNVRVAAISHFTDQTNIIDVFRGDNLQIRSQIVDQIKAQAERGQHRHSGNGEYAGVLTALFAIFALLNSFRGKGSPYTPFERRMVWFWGLATLFSLMAAWGRFSFLYALLYQLPGVSSIRNPIKFMHPFVVTWVILAAFGLEAFYRCYLCRPAAKPTPAAKVLQPAPWRRKLTLFDLSWIIGLLVVAFAIFVASHDYAGSGQNLAKYLVDQGFRDDQASRIAAFSIDEVRWFVLLFTLSAGVIITGMVVLWAARWTWVPWTFLCAIMIFDLSRADLPWVRYFNYDEKYSENDVTAVLKEKPYEHRVDARLSPRGGYDLPGDGNFAAIIHWWIENDFPYRNIQSLEIDQMPRAPFLDSAYLGAFPYRSTPGSSNPNQGLLDFYANITTAARLWKLTNTRYLLAAASVLPALNQFGDPGHHAFQIVKQFNLVPKPGLTLADVADAGDLTTQVTNTGNCALIEDTNVLPRAKLYSAWRVETSDQTTLQTLTDPQWDPSQSVLVSVESNAPPVPAPSAAPGANPGTVTITDYNPKDIRLQASAKTPAVLLYNDRTAPDWHVWVDGKPSQLLRCNYIMRGVYLPVGDHTVEFRFQPAIGPLYVTLAAFAVGLVLAAWLLWFRFAKKSEKPVP